MTDTAQENLPGQRPRDVRVTVNRQPVELPAKRLTGLEVKQAAIAQGVAIEAGFQLSLKRGDHYEVIGDTDTVEARRGEEFLAVAPDDNS